MSVSITSLPVRTLIQVLKHLRHGEIGFDYVRDPRTSTRTALLQYIATSHSDAEIIAAIQAVCPPLDQAAVKVDTDEASAAVEKPAISESADRQAADRQTAATDDATQIAQALARLAGKASCDIDTVKRVVKEAFEDENEAIRQHYLRLEAAFAARTAPTVVHLKIADAPSLVDLGVQHRNFPDLLKACSARDKDGNRLNIWISGPAGTGKTTAASKVAAALGMPFEFNGAMSTEYEMAGFRDASGRYHDTSFRRRYEQGGIWLGDEMDATLKKATLWLNAALANGHCMFPDGMIQRHKDFICLVGANTKGMGGTSDYSAREKQDLTFRDRFVDQDWPIDEALETALASHPTWVTRVQEMRKRVAQRGIKGHLITPRATFKGEALLAAGLSEDYVATAVLRGGLTDDQWVALCR